MKIGIVPMSAKPFHKGHNSLIKFAAGHEILEPLVKLGFSKQENDEVNVYVSYSSRGVRKRKDPNDPRTIKKGARKIEVPIEGEAPVFGKDMEYIWDNILTPENLQYAGTNVNIITPNMSGIRSPVNAGFEIANAFKNAYILSKEQEYNGETAITKWIDPISNKEYNIDDTIINFYCGEDDLNRYSEERMIELYGELYINDLVNVIGIPRVVPISGTKMRDYLCSGNTEELKKMLPSSLSEINKQSIADILSKSVTCGYPSSRDILKLESVVKKYIFTYING